MSADRVKMWIAEYDRALARLQEAANADPAENDVVVDGTIQRFEFTFELAWKLMKAALEHQGIVVQSPRAAIKEAFKVGLIADGDGWIDMLEDRNRTTHLYDEEQCRQVYGKIKERHIGLMESLGREVGKTE
ncbi:MAG TPA: nucleotidyltransferase substrate binding protein [Kiritimatiellia bacterium]|nr:nucleotidyltransferase substrate binding protein [Kiritimatiellia bacterium]HNS80432.1 nucleotidyltransferase substrate binding protein [Kiritimatiellia bacterium]HPA77346.1 nucleotidyltransferase substrate binding protein [Kiritimatiellia bacterium]HQQ05276.1 nucleotidyltransferase substrate binding protein [Kiritimatiellia bacterium]